jgi:hypothetical protein
MEDDLRDFFRKEFEKADKIELTIALNALEVDEPEDQDDVEERKMMREELIRRGGPASAEAVRTWLAESFAERERQVIEWGATKTDDDWRRTAPCLCRNETVQLLHGTTSNGYLWKGHLCACRGWECTECGRVIDKQTDCCR